MWHRKYDDAYKDLCEGASDMRGLDTRHGGLRRISIRGVVLVARSVMLSASTILTWTKVNCDVKFKARGGQKAKS